MPLTLWRWPPCACVPTYLLTSPTRYSTMMGFGHYLQTDSNPIEPFSNFSSLISNRERKHHHVAPRDGESLRTLLPQPQKPLCPCLPRILGGFFGVFFFFWKLGVLPSERGDSADGVPKSTPYLRMAHLDDEKAQEIYIGERDLVWVWFHIVPRAWSIGCYPVQLCEFRDGSLHTDCQSRSVHETRRSCAVACVTWTPTNHPAIRPSLMESRQGKHFGRQWLH